MNYTIYRPKRPNNKSEATTFREEQPKSNSLPKRFKSELENQNDRKSNCIPLISETIRSYTNRKFTNFK
jgi:hypothetical protein